MYDVDQINGYAELLCHHLGKGRFVALAMAVRASEYCDAASGVNTNLCRLIKPSPRTELTGDDRRGHCACFDICRDTDAAQLALSSRMLATLFERGIVCGLQCHFERGEIVAAVIGQCYRRLVRIGVLGNEIAPAQ